MGFASPYEPSRSTVTLADLLLRGGEIAARGVEQQGQIRAGLTQQLGQTIGAIPGQMQQQRDAAQERELRSQQLESARLRTGEQQRTIAGQRAMAGMMTGDQLPAGDVGPRQESFLTPDGLFDVAKITQALGKGGFGDRAGDLVKGAESINDSILKHQELEQKTAQAHAIMLGDLADGALKLTKTGTPLLQAMDFVVQPALVTKRVTQDDYATIRRHIAGLPPDQQQVALTNLMDQASRLSPTKTLAEGATETDRYGRQMAAGAKKPPTMAELAFDLSSTDPDVRARAKTAIDALHPPPKKDDTQLALDAYAKSIGKADSSALTYAERQTFDKNKAKIASDLSYANHQRERQYDIANPVPEKSASQDKLEQEARTVLARGLSSRSGGLGLEDAKVQQANHLLALLDQTYDAKTGEYSIPKVLQGELAAGLARLVAPGGNVGIEMMREFNQRTAKGDLAGALTYITGTPVSSATQDIAKMLKDSIERQGNVALENREGEMRYLRGLLPTGLEEARRTALEANTLNPLRQSRIAKDDKGNLKLWVSIDGGKTWK